MKDIILKLHEGLSAEAAKERFEREVGTISSTEIAEIEQELINEGLSPEEIKKDNRSVAIIMSALILGTAFVIATTYGTYRLIKYVYDIRIQKYVTGVAVAERAGRDGTILSRHKDGIRGVYAHRTRIAVAYESLPVYYNAARAADTATIRDRYRVN